MQNNFNNSGKMFQFIFRRDRIRIPIWILSIFLLTIAIAMAFTNLYPTEVERQAIAETMKNPAMTAMVGIGYGIKNYTAGAMMAHQMLLFTAIAVAIMSILLVTRHTRTDEEAGRSELIRSLPTGRLATLSATMILLILVNIVLAGGVGFSLYALNIESIDLEGALLYGTALGAVGIFFTSLTAVFAQLSESSRGTVGISIAALLLFYMIRAIGDVSIEVLSWFSPLGWILHSKVFVENLWWPIILTMIVSFFLFILAFYLHSIRDLEAGFLPARSGKETASRFLLRPFGLLFRLQRTTIISWAIGLFVLGASYGSVFGDLELFFTDNEMMQQLLAPDADISLTEQFITLLMKVMAIICSVPPLMVLLKVLSEERKNRTEQLLSRIVSRNNLLGNSMFLAVIVSVIMLLLTAVGLWSVSTAVMDEPIPFLTIMQAAMIYVPAIWIMLSFAVLLIGCIPRLSNLIWLYLMYSFIVLYLGDLLQFPNWLAPLSPYHYIPDIPAEAIDIKNMSILIMVAIIMTGIGFIGYNKRDIQG